MKLRYGPKLRRFALRPLEQDRFINLLDGAVRSGKTTALLPKMIYACFYPVRGWRVVAGLSKSSIYRNVLNDLFNLVGPSRYEYSMQTGLLRLCGSDWIVIGAADEGSEKAVRGLTCGVAFVDELTRVPQSFYNMLVSRLSEPGSRLYATTNPDVPTHWVKTEIIDNPRIRRDLEYIHCTMDDNPSLTSAYKDRMRRAYRGSFYRRFIEGLWVTAAGAVYGDYLNDRILFEEVPYMAANHSHAHIIGIDYGTVNPFVALEGLDDGETLWITRELYYDSSLEQQQKTDEEYLLMLERWIRQSVVPNPGPMVVIDPSAASFRALLASSGHWARDANNEVLEGIRTVSSVLARRRIRIHTSCRMLYDELSNYSWDTRAAARGEERPLKVRDHACDALRYMVMEIFKPWRVEL